MEGTYDKNDNPWMASEPTIGYAATGSGYTNTVVGRGDVDKVIPIGRCGFYTEEPDELQNRIADIERSIDRAEQGDESEWVTAEEFDKELQREFLWLQ